MQLKGKKLTTFISVVLLLCTATIGSAQTEKLTSLVNSLVTLSRMDEEDSPLRMEEFPVSDAVRETAETFVDFAASKGH